MFGLIGSIKYWIPSNGIKTNVALAAFLKNEKSYIDIVSCLVLWKEVKQQYSTLSPISMKRNISSFHKSLKTYYGMCRLNSMFLLWTGSTVQRGWAGKWDSSCLLFLCGARTPIQIYGRIKTINTYTYSILFTKPYLLQK